MGSLWVVGHCHDLFGGEVMLENQPKFKKRPKEGQFLFCGVENVCCQLSFHPLCFLVA